MPCNIRKLSTTFATLLCMIACMANSTVHAQISNEKARALISLTGITKQIYQYPTMIKQGINQSRQQNALIDAHLDKMLLIVDQTIKPQAIENTIINVLATRLSEKQADELTQWHQSELGQRINHLENKAAENQSIVDIQEKATALLEDEARVEIAQNMDQLTQGSHLALSLQKITSKAMYRSMMTALNPSQLDMNAYSEQMTLHEPRMKQALEQTILLSFLYHYQSLAITEFKAYETFLEQESTQTYNKAIHDALIDSMSKSLTALADQTIQALSQPEIQTNKTVETRTNPH